MDDSVAITEATEAFRSAYGYQPSGVWAAPGRVNLIGEHTDYNGGLALPIALPQRTFAAAARRDDGRVRLLSGDKEVVETTIDDIRAGEPVNWARYPTGSLWALRKAGYDVGGMDLAFSSQVPLGAGLSSSAAIEVAAAVAGVELFGLDVSREELADLCRQGENEIAQAPTGGMDQMASLCCIEGHALKLDCRDGSTQQVPFDLDDVGLALLVIDTQASHALGDGQYGQRRADCERACQILGIESLRELAADELDDAVAKLDERRARRVRHVVAEIDRVEQAVAAVVQGDYHRLGDLFVDSHCSLRDDYEVSCAELDVAVDTAVEAGALGARMTGGGFGGSAIALVRRVDVAAVQDAVVGAYQRAGFAHDPQFLVATAGPAAGAVTKEEQ